jgi:HD domain-containing protein
MVLAGIKVVDTPLVHDAMELARNSSEPYLFNHVMRSWLFAVVIAEDAKPAQDPELLAVSGILHDLGLTDRYAAQERFEVDGANAARSFLKERGIPAHQIQLVWDAIALHTTRSIALHKESEVAVIHSGIAIGVIGAGLDLIPQDKVRAILSEFPRLSMKRQFLDCLCGVVRRKPATTYDNTLRDLGTRYVKGYTAPSVADLFENAPFPE